MARMAGLEAKGGTGGIRGARGGVEQSDGGGVSGVCRSGGRGQGEAGGVDVS